MRKLIGTGSGWGTAYKFACSDNLVHLPHQVIKALADNMRRIAPEMIFGAAKIVCHGLQNERQSQRGGSLTSAEVTVQLNNELRLLKGQGEFDLIGSLKKSAQIVFNDTRGSYAAISEQQVAERLIGTMLFQVMDSRFLSRIREGVMLENKRSFLDQMSWENNLKKKIMPESQKMAKSFLKSLNSQFRAPAVRGMKKSTDLILGQKLKVLSAS